MSTREETITTKEYSYTVVLEPAEEGGYTVTCPALPGLVTEGDTLVEARVMAADAIRWDVLQILLVIWYQGSPSPSLVSRSSPYEST